MSHPIPTHASDTNLRFGWWSLLGFLALGIFLEALHGVKLGWYLDVGNETRRFMFTLAHTHGTLLSLVNIGAGLSARLLPGVNVTRGAARALIAATLLMPAGFLLGGVVIYGGDPGVGIWLVPVGAGLLLYAVARLAMAITKALRAK